MNNTILVADDDHSILDAIQIMLEEKGYLVTTTDNGGEVLEIEENLPGLILLDVWMSGTDGREVCNLLKKGEKTRHIPVIMISANNDIGDTVWEAGADDFLAKPFNIDDLLAKVTQHLKIAY